ncbi:hypothetical protein SLA2020_076250 [Shorea laevis]
MKMVRILHWSQCRNRWLANGMKEQGFHGLLTGIKARIDVLDINLELVELLDEGIMRLESLTPLAKMLGNGGCVKSGSGVIWWLVAEKSELVVNELWGVTIRAFRHHLAIKGW